MCRSAPRSPTSPGLHWNERKWRGPEVTHSHPHPHSHPRLPTHPRPPTHQPDPTGHLCPDQTGQPTPSFSLVSTSKETIHANQRIQEGINAVRRAADLYFGLKKRRRSLFSNMILITGGKVEFVFQQRKVSKWSFISGLKRGVGHVKIQNPCKKLVSPKVEQNDRVDPSPSWVGPNGVGIPSHPPPPAGTRESSKPSSLAQKDETPTHALTTPYRRDDPDPNHQRPHRHKHEPCPTPHTHPCQCTHTHTSIHTQPLEVRCGLWGLNGVL